MNALDPTVIVGTLAGVISVLAGIIYKVMQDRIVLLQGQNDKLQDRLSRELDMGRTYTEQLGRILVIVEGLRYEGQLPPVPRRRSHGQRRQHTGQSNDSGQDPGGTP